MSTWETLEQDALVGTYTGLNKCKFSKFLESLSSEARHHVQAAVENEKISGRALYHALVDRGMDCRHTVFREHRACKCICFLEKD